MAPERDELRIVLERFVDLLDQMDELRLFFLAKNRSQMSGKVEHSVLVSKQRFQTARCRFENDRSAVLRIGEPLDETPSFEPIYDRGHCASR